MNILNTIRWDKLSLLLLLVYSGCNALYQPDQEHTLLCSYYYKSASKIIKLPFNTLKTVYISTDTCSGIEIDYYHYENNRTDRCINFKFFAPLDSIEKLDTISDLFLKTPVSIISYSDLSILSPENYCDTDSFYYSNNHTKYLVENFSNMSDQPVYKLSDSEFIRIFKVYGLMDKFSGNLEYNQLAFPLLTEEFSKSPVWQFHYRKIFSRTVIDAKAPLGLKRLKNKRITQCYMTYD